MVYLDEKVKNLCARFIDTSGAAQRFQSISGRIYSMKRTKIVCTMGPSTDSKEVLGALVDAGMDVARFNFSHGSYEEHKGRMDLLKEVRAEKKKPIAIMLDTKGPEIRTKLLKDGKKVELVEGQTFTLTTRDVEGTNEIVSQTYDRLPTDLKPGDTVLIDDGLIAMTVQETTDTDVVCKVDNGGMLGERKGINLPNVEIHLPGITEKDKQDIIFGIGQGIDFIAASFVRSADNIREIRDLLRQHHAEDVHIIAKVESQEGIRKRRDSGMGGSAYPEDDHRKGERCLQAGHRGNADAGFDDPQSASDPGGGDGCSDGHHAVHRCDHAVRRDGCRKVPGRGCEDDGAYLRVHRAVL